MERRAFVRGAFGFAAFIALASAGAAVSRNAAFDFVTPVVTDPLSCVGPVMQSGIRLVEHGDAIRGMLGDTHLFDVDATGAELIRLADGTRTIDELAGATQARLNPADVASFFVTLGKSGYLANTVLVNLTETRA